MRYQTKARAVAPHVSAQLGDRRNIGGLFGIRVQHEALGHLPDKDLAIVGCRGNERVVEGTPTELLALSLVHLI
jgi:hypothetical protein